MRTSAFSRLSGTMKITASAEYLEPSEHLPSAEQLEPSEHLLAGHLEHLEHLESALTSGTNRTSDHGISRTAKTMQTHPRI
jgi:hypothetical protein